MKYDRPVWQLMHACADALPEEFRLEDVRSWFAENYPEVGDATIRAHVVGLTEGGAKHPQFQRRSPLFRRVSRGIYSPIPFDERGELPEDGPADEAAAPIRFRLVGPPEDEIVDISEQDDQDRLEDLGDDEVERRIRADLLQEEGEDDEDDIDRRIRSGLSHHDEVQRQDHEPDETPQVEPEVEHAAVELEHDEAEPDDEAEPGDEADLDQAEHDEVELVEVEPEAGQSGEDSAADFWPFPVEEPFHGDAMAQAAGVRRKRREKDERRRRKAAKREAKRRAELNDERARRALDSPPTLHFDPEFAHTGPTEVPVVGPRAIEAERARQMAARLEAAQRESVSELEKARRAAQDGLDAERRRLAAEREELARIAEERAELTRRARDQIETERARLEAERLQAERVRAEQEAAERLKAAEKAETQRIAAEKAEAERIAAEKAEAARVEAERVAAEQVEAARLETERIEAQRRAAEQHAARVAEEKAIAEAEAAVRAETDRAAAARAETTRLLAERVEAEQEAEQEKKRVNKLRKAARKERERAQMLEREEVERTARREAEQNAREIAEQHLREASDRRRREDDERQRGEQVRRDLARLEQQEHERIEAERAMQARAEEERSREAFERAEGERIAFEASHAEREARERAQLESEERQLHVTLRPMMEDPQVPAPPPAPLVAAEDESTDVFDSFEFEPNDPAVPESHDDRFSSPGGIVIVRAPRPNDEPAASQSPTSVESSVVAHHSGDEAAELADDTQETAASFDTDDVAVRASDAIVLGSVGQRLGVPAPAREAFRDLAFQRARRDAELSGSRWFVLSAEHGLLEPQEWMSPDERAMTEIEPRHRAAWATWVVARLETLVGELPGQLVQVEAPDVIAAPVLAALRAAGAETAEGPILRAESAAADVPVPHSDGAPDGHADECDHDDDSFEQELDHEHDEPSPVQAVSSTLLADERPDAQVIPFVRASSVAEHLADPHQSMSAHNTPSLPHLPGLYAWSVDHAGSRDLNRALRLPVRAGIIYVGQVGGGAGLSDSGLSINDHVTRVQLNGRARASTFRMTLATSLAKFLGLHTIEDPRLTQWMLEHLSIAIWPTEDVAGLQQLQSAVVDELAPALNVDRRHSGEYRDRLAELSGRLA